MSKAWKPARNGVGQERKAEVGKEEPAGLVALSKRFARFRREHPRRTRIPDDLREAVLVLLREVAPAKVYRSCGISFGQVLSWKEAKARRSESPEVRVWSVVDEEPMKLATGSTEATASELDLRVGPWSVRVRLAGPEPTGRG